MPAPLEDDHDRDAASEPERDGPPALRDRWMDLELSDGDLVIYDHHNHHAWIQSDESLDVGATD